MQNRKNKRRQEKRAEKRLEKQKVQQEMIEKEKELEEQEKPEETQETVVENQAQVVEKEEQEETCCQEKQEEKQEEKEEVACCCKEEPKEKPKVSESRPKDNSSYGEFFIGLTIGAVLLALGALIVFLFQIDYMRGLEKKVTELQNSIAQSESKTDIKFIQDKTASLEKKIASLDYSSLLQGIENKILVLQKQQEGSKEEIKKFATLEAVNQNLNQIEKNIAAQKQDFDHFKTLQDMNYQEVSKKIDEKSASVNNAIEALKQQNSSENAIKTLGENLEKVQVNFQDKANEIQKQIEALKQNDSTKALELKLEFLQGTLQTLQQQYAEHVENSKKLQSSIDALEAKVEKMSTTSSEPK